MFLLGGTLVIVLLRQAWPYVVWRCVVPEHLACASGCGCGCSFCMRLIKFSGLPGALQLGSTHTQCTHIHTVMHKCIHVCLLIGVQIRHVHMLRGDRQRESYWTCKPLIRLTQIWYHCNQISDDAEYSMSGFGQSLVTFVAEKWHGALVPNAITALASCTLSTAEIQILQRKMDWPSNLKHAAFCTNTQRDDQSHATAVIVLWVSVLINLYILQGMCIFSTQCAIDIVAIIINIFITLEQLTTTFTINYGNQYLFATACEDMKSRWKCI